MIPGSNLGGKTKLIKVIVKLRGISFRGQSKGEREH